MKQKDTLVQLEELAKRIGLMVKQYNDLSRSESLESRLVYGNVNPYGNDDKPEPKIIYSFDTDGENSWSSSGCEWQSSSYNC